MNRGIVVCGGGATYFTGAYLLGGLLRYFDCTTPIQVWHVGDEELDATMGQLIGRFDVECVDALKFCPRIPAKELAGWPLKPFSILHCPFCEVLALDSDNFPTRNPEYLFDLPSYKALGAVFWPDVKPSTERSPIWSYVGIPYRHEPEFESGQILVDKSKCREPLELAMRMNEEAGTFYRLLWGDKDTYRFAWHHYGRPFAMTPRPLEMLSIKGGPCCSGVMCQHDMEGNRIFQHRNSFKWQLHGENPRVPGFLFEGECRELLQDLRAQWDGRIARERNRHATLWNAKFQTELQKTHWAVDGLGRMNWMVVTTTESPVPFAGDDARNDEDTGPLLETETCKEEYSSVDAADEQAVSKPNFRPGDQHFFHGLDNWPEAEVEDFSECRFCENAFTDLLYQQRFSRWKLRQDKNRLLLDLGDEKRTHLTLERHAHEAVWTGVLRDPYDGSEAPVRFEPLGRRYAALGTRLHSPIHKLAVESLSVFSSAPGIGDQVAALYACAGLADLGYQVRFHARQAAWSGRCQMPGLEISPHPPSDGALDMNKGYFAQLRHSEDKPRWYASAVFNDGVVHGKRPGLCEAEFQPCFPFDRYVLFMPFAAREERDWPEMHWRRLAHLIDNANYHVVVIGLEKDERRIYRTFNESRAMWVLDQDPEWVIDAMLGATAVIGPDSGMIHVAGLHGVPAICVHAQLPSQFLFSCAPSVISVIPDTNCAGCRWQPENGFTSACHAGCSALATVGPETVLRAFHDIAPPANREKGEFWADRHISPPQGIVPPVNRWKPVRAMTVDQEAEATREAADRFNAMSTEEARELVSKLMLPDWLYRVWPPRDRLEELLMEKLYPRAESATKTIAATRAYILSVDRETNRERVVSALRCLSAYEMPSIEVVLGYTRASMPKELVKRYFKRSQPPSGVRLPDLTLTAMRVWERITERDDEWAYVLEDDVRVGNVPAGFDLTRWINVPHDAEMLTFNRHAADVAYDESTAAYAVSHSGGSSHALLISKAAAGKLLEYARKWGWRREVDIDLYTVSRGFSSWLRTGYNEWCSRPEFVDVKLKDGEKIAHYDLATSSVFAQVSSPCPPIATLAIAPYESEDEKMPLHAVWDLAE